VIIDLDSVDIFTRPDVTDMHKQANGLSFVAEEARSRIPVLEACSFFVTGRKNSSKAYGEERNGFWLAREET